MRQPSASITTLCRGVSITSHHCYHSSVVRVSNENNRFPSAIELGKMKAAAANESCNDSSAFRDESSSEHSKGLETTHEQKIDGPVHIRLGTGELGSDGNQGHLSHKTSNQMRRPPSDFDAKIINLYASPGGNSSELDSFVEKWLPNCTIEEISSFMRISGKKSRSKSHLHLKRHLPSIASRIEALSTTWKFRDSSAILYSLQCLQEEDDGYLAIVTVMTKAISKSIGSGEVASAKAISIALLGLQNNKLRARQSIELLDSMTLMIKSGKQSFDAQAVGNALYGMQGMSSDHVEVRSMISALLGKVHSCKESLSGQAISTALYGMQGMSSDHAEVRSMVSVLLSKVHSCKESFDAQAISNSLYGMRQMSSDHAEVRSMISALSGKLYSCNESLSTQALMNALYGMKSMSSDHVEVRSMLSALLGEVHSCEDTFSAQAVGNALFSLRHMNSDHAEVISITSALLSKLEVSE